MKLLETFEVKVLLLIGEITKVLTEGNLFCNRSACSEPNFQKTLPPGATGTPLARYLLHSLDMIDFDCYHKGFFDVYLILLRQMKGLGFILKYIIHVDVRFA